MKAPAFQFYADDFLGGVADMTQSEVGAYILLLCHQWNKGEIPQDAERASLIAKGGVSAHVLSKFPSGKNVRLEAVRASAAAFRAACSQAGRSGGGNPNFAKGKPNPYKGTDKGTFIEGHKGTYKGSDKGPINSPISDLRSPISDIKLNQRGAATPLPFSSAEFSEAWTDFERHRTEKRKPITPTARKGALRMLEEMGERRAVAALRHTVAMGWQGIREPESNGAQQFPREPAANSYEAQDRRRAEELMKDVEAAQRIKAMFAPELAGFDNK